MKLVKGGEKPQREREERCDLPPGLKTKDRLCLPSGPLRLGRVMKQSPALYQPDFVLSQGLRFCHLLCNLGQVTCPLRTCLPRTSTCPRRWPRTFPPGSDNVGSIGTLSDGSGTAAAVGKRNKTFEKMQQHCPVGRPAPSRLRGQALVWRWQAPRRARGTGPGRQGKGQASFFTSLGPELVVCKTGKMIIAAARACSGA